MSFKLLAIRPLKECNPKFLKVLNEFQIYKLYNDYTFNLTDSDDPKSEIQSVTFDQELPENLFNIYSFDKEINVNISAIVGRNGSGKSSIVELFYIAMFNIGCVTKTLPKKDDEGNIIKKEARVFVEIYYSKGSEIFKLSLNERGIQIFSQLNPESGFSNLQIKKVQSKNHLEYLFYSLVINYSHYSLNSKYLGNWVKHIFHKNDGYQTPIVLNPYRDEGNIDMNKEDYLTRSRLLAQLFYSKKIGEKTLNFRELAPDRTANKLKLEFNKKKTTLNNIPSSYQSFIRKNRKKILEAILEYFHYPFKSASYSITEKMLSECVNYIIVKIISISKKYPPYNSKEFSFWHRVIVEKDGKKSSELQINFHRFSIFLNELYLDKSHITFKLRQAFNFIVNYKFYLANTNNFIEIDKFSKQLNPNSNLSTQKLMELVPPAFFDINIEFIGGFEFETLSSGEKQKIFSTASFSYHLLNLNSVEKDNSIEKKEYKDINIVFDEIELYFHPDLQTTFVFDFLETLKRIHLDKIDRINCIFITHSPFILSDIPRNNILLLENKIDSELSLGVHNTFGSNIHDLLKENFFLKKGTIGSFAISKINEVINYINLYRFEDELKELQKSKIAPESLYEAKLSYINAEIKNLREKEVTINSSDAIKIIQIIGEPILRKKLTDMYNDYIPQQ